MPDQCPMTSLRFSPHTDSAGSGALPFAVPALSRRGHGGHHGTGDSWCDREVTLTQLERARVCKPTAGESESGYCSLLGCCVPPVFHSIRFIASIPLPLSSAPWSCPILPTLQPQSPRLSFISLPAHSPVHHGLLHIRWKV